MGEKQTAATTLIKEGDHDRSPSFHIYTFSSLLSQYFLIQYVRLSINQIDEDKEERFNQ